MIQHHAHSLVFTLFVAGLAAGQLRTLAADDWQPAAVPIHSRWAEAVTPDHVWPDYPRPQMVRPRWMNLNGLWKYAIRDRQSSPLQPPASDAEWTGQILVPFAVESSLSGVGKSVQADQQLWYERRFELQQLKEGERWLLHFGAVDWQCTVWVNGQQVGEHTGGYDPFHFDITPALHAGRNTVAVAVWDPTDQGDQPRGKQVLRPRGIWYTAVTGIWQTVWLEPVPAVHIRQVAIVPDVDHEQAVVTVTTSRPCQIQLRASGTDVPTVAASGSSDTPIVVKLRDPKLWSPDRPFLYDLQVSTTTAGQAADHVGCYFGMRKIALGKDKQGRLRLMLNNEPLFQFGPLDQGWWPDGLYTAPSDEALRYDIEMTKKFGMNLARKHVKYEPARWYYWCDRLGLLVWQDMPSGGAGKSDESKANYRRELKAMLDALQPFPSIVVWVPFNEGWGQHDTEDVVSRIKELDPSRLVNEASGWSDQGSGDISDMHKYPGPAMRTAEPDRAMVLGEFGGLGLPIKNHTWLAEKSWGYRSFSDAGSLTDAYVNLLQRLRPLIGRGLSAAVYTQTTDVEIEINGLMTYDRRVVKMDLQRMQEAAAKLYLPPPIVSTLVPTSEQQPQSWQYSFRQPADGWQQPDFQTVGWLTGPGGFGTRGTPGSVVRTEWKSSDIWMRRTFELKQLPAAGTLILMMHHDEDTEVYLNGKPIGKFNEYTRGYQATELGREAARALRSGVNTLAIHCRQTTGGQYIDAGLSLITEAKR